jgi:hypothetical protein
MKSVLKFLNTTILMAFFSNCISAQIEVPIFGKQTILNGYTKTLKGETIPYFSIYPDFVNLALLTRCSDGKKSIEWETAIIPNNLDNTYAYFNWIAAHSTGTSKGDRNFDLFINDVFVLTFTTHPKTYDPTWSFVGNDSTKLVFNYLKQDGALDAHGIAYLRVPLSKYEKGKALKISVVGQKQDSPDWYMTFQYPFEEKMDVAALPFLLKTNNAQKVPLLFTVLHFGNPTNIEIEINGKLQKKQLIVNGMNSFEIAVDTVLKKTDLNIKAKIGDQLSVEKQLSIYPVNKRKIYFIHNAHTDIGYSHIQEEVEKIHTENIYEALKLIKETKAYPEYSRFVWNVESLWAVENFLRTANKSDQKAFFEAVRNKQIGLSGFYANVLTGLCNPTEMDWITDYAVQIRKSQKLPIKSVMMSDIPGISWSMVHSLAKQGFRYYSSGPNYIESMPDKGDRIGSFLRAVGDKPFWWKSTDGKDSILLWTAGKGYSSWHGFAPGGIIDRGEKKIAAYLTELDQEQYPYSIVQWRYNIFSDNGKTDNKISDFVRHWNDQYESPSIRLSTVNDLFEDFEKANGKTIPSLSGDLTPYWEDGAYSSAKEEVDARHTSFKIVELEKIAKIKKIKLDSVELYNAKKFVVLWHEHTWGAYNSISESDSKFAIHQWEYKKRLLDSAIYFTNKIQQQLQLSTNYQNAESATPINNRVIPTLVYAIDSSTGFIKSIQLNGKEWVNPTKYTGLGGAIYVKGYNPSDYFLSKVKKIEWTELGPITKTQRITCSMEGMKEVVYEISKSILEDKLHITVELDKQSIRDKESVHIALPFSISQPTVRVGIGNSFISPEKGQLKGSNREFFSVQKWIDISNENLGVTIACPAAALFELGEMIDENRIKRDTKIWKEESKSSATLFIYVMNNYWHTNYKADQEGKVKFEIVLQFHQKFNLSEAQKLGDQASAGFGLSDF